MELCCVREGHLVHMYVLILDQEAFIRLSIHPAATHPPTLIEPHRIDTSARLVVLLRRDIKSTEVRVKEHGGGWTFRYVFCSGRLRILSARLHLYVVFLLITRPVKG